MFAGRRRFVVVALVAVSLVAGTSCTPDSRTRAGDEPTREVEDTVQDIGVTEISSGDAGRGSQSPQVVVSGSVEDSVEVTGDLPGAGYTYLTLHRGEKRTGGYSVRVGSVRREGGEVVVEVELRDPPEGQVVAQVITYPYTVVAVSGVGTDEDFVFEDRSGERLDWPVQVR